MGSLTLFGPGFVLVSNITFLVQHHYYYTSSFKCNPQDASGSETCCNVYFSLFCFFLSLLLMSWVNSHTVTWCFCSCKWLQSCWFQHIFLTLSKCWLGLVSTWSSWSWSCSCLGLDTRSFDRVLVSIKEWWRLAMRWPETRTLKNSNSWVSWAKGYVHVTLNFILIFKCNCK